MAKQSLQGQQIILNTINVTPYLERTREERKQALALQRFPEFTSDLRVMKGYDFPYKIRPNRIVIRPYQPKGKTAGGVYLERNERWPNIFGHIIAIAKDYQGAVPLNPGDLVHFKHLTEEFLFDEAPQNPRYIGEIVECVLVHEENIRFVFDPAPVEFKL
jgi:co-chaperonin GroES (HSP10)